MAVVEREPGAEAVMHASSPDSWASTVDHKKIGIMYVVLSLVFLVIGGKGMAIRCQLIKPRFDLLSADTFNELFTMHGTTMVFFVGMPIRSAWPIILFP